MDNIEKAKLAEELIESVIPYYCSPEDIFSSDELSGWAKDNGFLSAEDADKLESRIDELQDEITRLEAELQSRS